MFVVHSLFIFIKENSRRIHPLLVFGMLVADAIAKYRLCRFLIPQHTDSYIYDELFSDFLFAWNKKYVNLTHSLREGFWQPLTTNEQAHAYITYEYTYIIRERCRIRFVWLFFLPKFSLDETRINTYMNKRTFGASLRPSVLQR